MADTLGNILVPEIAVIGTFPLVTDFPWERTDERNVAIHRFLYGDGKTEQRFLLGAKARTFTFKKKALCPDDHDALATFWELNQGTFGAFQYLVPNEDGTFTSLNVRFKDQTISFDGVVGSILSTGLTFCEDVDPASAPTYPLTGVDIRFPGIELSAALLNPIQELIPLIKIKVRDTDYPIMYLSDRRCTIGSQLYLPRLLKRGPIEIGLNSETAPVTLTFGNADKVISALSNSTVLKRAQVEIAFYDARYTNRRLDFWKGYIIDYDLNEGPSFDIQVAEGIYELTLAYPTRRFSRSCLRILGNVNSGCPYFLVGSGGNPNFCDKNYATADGCKSHGMDGFFGGTIVDVESIRTKDNSTGIFGIGRNTLTVVSEVSASIYGQAVPEIYCKFPASPDSTVGMPVNCLLAAGIDEGDFYNALGIVGAGPLGAYADASPAFNPFLLDGQPPHGWPNSSFGLRRSLGHTPTQNLDPDGGSQWLSLARGGSTPAFVGVQLTQIATDSVLDDNQSAGIAFVEIRRVDAKGLQLDTLADHSMQVSVREGLGGYKWTAPGDNSFVNTGLTDPVWIAVNMLLKALGLWGAPPTAAPDINEQEAVFDVDSAVFISEAVVSDIVTSMFPTAISSGGSVNSDLVIAAAGIGFTVGNFLPIPGGDGHAAIILDDVDANGAVLKISLQNPGNFYTSGTYDLSGGDGSGLAITITTTTINTFASTETQFTFNGIIAQEQPLKDILLQVVNTFLGYWSFAFGRLKIGARYNSSVKSALTIGNILLGSTSFSPLVASFNRLLATYADSQYGFVSNTIDIYDETHATLLGTPENPMFLPADMNFVAVSTQSQAARLATTRLREEICGYQASTFEYGKAVKTASTLLAAEIEPGLICSLEVDDSPNYPPTAEDNTSDPQVGKTKYIEFRAKKIILQEDYRLDIEGVATHNDIYALVGGPKPADIPANPLPIIKKFAPDNCRLVVSTERDGALKFSNFAIGINPLSVHIGSFDIYYVNERNSPYSRLVGVTADTYVVPPATQTFNYEGTMPSSGSWILVGTELMQVIAVTPDTTNSNTGTFKVLRAQLGTQYQDHTRKSITVLDIDPDFPGLIKLSSTVGIHPGHKLFKNSNFGMITTLSEVANWVYIARPITGLQIGDALIVDERIWNISVQHHIISFQPRFFDLPSRASFVDTIPLEMAGVVLVTAFFENTRGIRSDLVYLFPTAVDRLEVRTLPYTPTLWPYSVRTLGNHRFVMQASGLAKGEYTDVFQNLPVTEPQTFEYALVSEFKGTVQPLETPPQLTSIVPTPSISPVFGGTTITYPSLLEFTGAINSELAIQIKIVGGNEILSAPWAAKDFGIDDSSTMLDVMTSLAAWLNRQDVHSFGAFYNAVPDALPTSGDFLALQDKFNWGGSVQALYSGGIIIKGISGVKNSPGFWRLLGITQGRRYITDFTNGPITSDASPISKSTGPLVDAVLIALQDLPESNDPRVLGLNIYASLDGTDDIFLLVGSVLNHTKTFLDVTPENILLAGNYLVAGGGLRNSVKRSSEKFGPYLPAVNAAPSLVTLKKNGIPWCDFMIIKNIAGEQHSQNISNKVHGFALDPVSQDDIITADFDNRLDGNIDIFVELQ